MRGRVATLGLLNLGLALFLPSSPVRADFAGSITIPTQTIDSTQTNFGPTTTSLLGKDPFTIFQFNSAGIAAPPGQVAQLAAVTVSLKYEFDNTIQLTFNQPSVGTVTASGIMHLSVDGVNGGPAIQDIVNTPTFFTQKTLSFPDQFQGQNFITPVKVVGGISAMTYTDSTTLSTFTGNGALTAPVTATASSSYLNSAGNGAGGSSTFASAALSVTYYYNFVSIVPEPTSFVLMGLGTAGLCVVHRVRGRRSLQAAS